MIKLLDLRKLARQSVVTLKSIERIIKETRCHHNGENYYHAVGSGTLNNSY